MFKKKITVFLLIISILFTVSACKNKTINQEKTNIQTETKSEDENIVSVAVLGFSFIAPEKWKNSQNIESLLFDPSYDENDLFYGTADFSFFSDETIEKLNNFMDSEKDPSSKEYAEILDERKPLLSFYVLRKKLLKNSPISNITNLPNNDFLGEQNELVYYLSYPNKEDIKGLSETSKKDYNALHDEIYQLKKSIKLFQPTFLEDPSEKVDNTNSFPKFQSKDINGQEINNSIFSQYKLTMINVWGTFCSPCIEEMPELEKLYNEMKNENVNIIGIIGDAEGNEKIAEDIINKKKVTYTNIFPDKNIEKHFLKDIHAYPTSIFVNSKGKIVGKPIVGAINKSAYKEEIMKMLKK